MSTSASRKVDTGGGKVVSCSRQQFVARRASSLNVARRTLLSVVQYRARARQEQQSVPIKNERVRTVAERVAFPL